MDNVCAGIVYHKNIPFVTKSVGTIVHGSIKIAYFLLFLPLISKLPDSHWKCLLRKKTTCWIPRNKHSFSSLNSTCVKRLAVSDISGIVGHDFTTQYRRPQYVGITTSLKRSRTDILFYFKKLELFKGLSWAWKLECRSLPSSAYSVGQRRTPWRIPKYLCRKATT